MEFRKTLTGTLTCRKLPGKQALNIDVEKKISEWFKEHHTASDPGLSYEVEFSRNGQSQFVECHTRIQSSLGRWNAYDWGRSPDESLARCLKSLERIAV
jgi:hypothetical protein